MPNADTTDRGGEERDREALSYLDSSTIIYTGDQIDFLTYRDTLTDHDLIQVITHAMTQYANAEVRKVLTKLLDEDEIMTDNTRHEVRAVNISYIQSLIKSLK